MSFKEIEEQLTKNEHQIEIRNVNNVPCFHMPFEETNSMLLITRAGPTCSDEEFENVRKGKSDQTMNYHCHDCFFLVYVRKGFNLELVEDRQILVSEGDLLFLTPYTLHHNFHTDESNVLFFHIKPQLLFEFLGSSLSENILFSDFFLSFQRDPHIKKSLFFNNCMEDVRWIMERILNEYLGKQFLSNVLIQYLFGTLIVELARQQAYKAHHFSDSEAETMQSILKYITEHYRDVTLDAVANHFGYNTSYFSRKIKQFSGKTYQQLLSDYRLSQAVLLLHKGQLSVEEIAFSCGYHELSTFYKAFTRKFHTTPRKFVGIE